MSVDENSRVGAIVTKVSAVDPDGGPVTYSISPSKSVMSTFVCVRFPFHR